MKIAEIEEVQKLERKIRELKIVIGNNAIDKLNDNRDMQIRVLKDVNDDLKLENKKLKKKIDQLENMMYIETVDNEDYEEYEYRHSKVDDCE